MVRAAETLTFITGNPHKAEQLSEYLDYPVEQQSVAIPEIQSLSPREVVTAKATAAYEHLGQPILVEDTSIRFVALGRLPGTYIKAFIEELGVEGLCRLLDNYDTRDAVVETWFAFCDEGGVRLFTAAMECTVADSPAGEDGMGTDSILIPKGWEKTWGEMTKEEETQSSVRLRAINKLRDFLLSLG